MGSGARKSAKAQERSAYATRIKAYAALYRNPADPSGVHRHELGGINEGLFDNALATPAPGLVNAKWQIYQFSKRAESMTNIVDPTNYEWIERDNGAPAGTALQMDRTILGGAVKVITGATDGNYYYYEAYQRLAKGGQGKDLWFEATVVVDDVDRSQFFIGVCEHITAPNDVFENRVNCVGFVKYDAEADITFEVRNAGNASQSGEDFMANNTEMALGFRYLSAYSQCAYYVDHEYVGRARTYDAPAVMMPVTFGIKTKEASLKTLWVKQIVLGVEI